ncbi:TIGR02996 domain-containing protein [Tautonia plasticadhaerens]|uniref:TIGR02996 domain-containing protein n=1 Tax=Tautonia plasticadhaerens TaxID=2527974 RepID=A0A518H2C9_9BACT|nr:TIGR02996 domain-containing protein [Tautonia plasticadhaerens]QDV34970.1 hypothetical protein ElP_28670 [Tautonia plasticadhaerens]
MPLSDAELALIAAIHADPRNDAPRLAYADWLEANGLGDEAKFIRVQCEQPYFSLITRDGIRPATDSGRIKFEDPERMEQAIELLGRIYPSERYPETRYYDEYRRGLPLYEEKLNDGNLRYSAAQIRADMSPLVRYRLHLETSRLADWLNHPIMQFVDVLRISPGWEDDDDVEDIRADDLRALAASPLIDRLEKLGLGVDMAPDAVELARSLERRVEVEYGDWTI